VEHIGDLFAFIPDYGATVVFVLFMVLWHKRTMRRDEQFHEVLLQLNQSLMDCVAEIKERKPTPRS